MKRIFTLLAVVLLVAGCDDIFEKDISNERVEVVSPADRAQTVQGEVAFLWRATEGATAYRVTVVAPSFANPSQVVADTVMYNDSLSVKLSLRLVMPQGDYQWSVRGLNSGYMTTEQVRSLKVITSDRDISQAPVEVLSPQASVQEGTVGFLWKALDGVTGYRVTVVAPSFAQAGRVVADTLLAADKLALSLKMETGQYQWNVKGVNPSFVSPDNIRDLTVVTAEKDISGTKTDAVSPLATATEGAVVFRWNTLEGASSYRLRVVAPSFDIPLIVVADTILSSDKLSCALKIVPGNYQWNLTGANSVYRTPDNIHSLKVVSAEKDISGMKVEATAPLAAVTEGTVGFLWKALEGAKNYRLTVVSPSFAQAQKVVADTLLAADKLSCNLKLARGDYQWNLVATNGAYTSSDNIRSLKVASPDKDISAARVEIVAPAAEAAEGDVTFLWRELDGATSYRVTVVEPSFTQVSRVVKDTTITGIKLSLKMAAGDYQWSIRALNASYSTAEQRLALHVTPKWKDISAARVEVVSPADGLTAKSGKITFLWREVDGATSYRVTVVSPSFAAATKVVVDKLVEDGVSVKQTLEPGVYQWRIQARNPLYATREQVFTLNVVAPEP